MSDLIDISAKPRTTLIQGRENDEPINHQVHSTTYVEYSDNISVAKSKKKIFVGANLCNTENKINHYYREGHLQRLKTTISCGFWTVADDPLLIILGY
jgi:hypothetical protein